MCFPRPEAASHRVVWVVCVRSLHQVESGMAKSARSISWHVQVLNHEVMTFDEEWFQEVWGEESLKRAHGFNGFRDAIMF